MTGPAHDLQALDVPALDVPALRTVLSWELRRLRGQLLPRLVVAACLLGPFALLAAARLQGQLPRDTPFGRWLGESGPALPLVLLGFGAAWALPLVAGLMAGDVFSGEDRHRTWPLLLTRSCPHSQLFAAKCLAALLAAVAATAALALAGAAAGLLSALLPGAGTVRDRLAVVGLDGALLDAGAAAGRVALAWVCVLPGVLVFAALAVLASVVTRWSAAGLGTAGVAGLVSSLLAGVDAGPRWRALLPTTGLESWHALLTATPAAGPLVRPAATCLGWTVLLLLLARAVALGRDAT